MLDDPPAEIIWNLLLGKGLIDNVNSAVGPPDTSPDDYVTLTDIGGFNEGKLSDGSVIYHPGVQVRTRSQSYKIAHGLCANIVKELCSFENEQVSVGSNNYNVVSSMMISPPIYMGQEEDNLREHFVSDINVTIKQL